MTSKQFADYIRKKTKTNSSTFTDADILLYANIIKDDIAKEVNKANEDYFGIRIVRDLKDGKRNYLFPSYVMGKIKYLQAKLDGTKQRRIDEFDINTYERPTDEDAILANWAGREPMFDIFGGEIVIYSGEPIIDVTGGLELWAIIYPADLTSLSGTSDMSIAPNKTSFGMPRQLHMVWALKVAIEYKTSKEKPIPLTEREQNIQIELDAAINSLKNQNLDRTLIATVPDCGNNGQDF